MTTYFASRNSADPRTDEDAAMSYQSFGGHATLAEAIQALVAGVVREVTWLTTERYASEFTKKRAADLVAAIPLMTALEPIPNTSDSVEVVGLRFSINAR